MRLLRVPLLTLCICIKLATAQFLIGSGVSELEMRGFDLGGLILTRLFRDILANLLGLLSRLGRVVAVTLLLVHRVLLAACIDLVEGIRAVNIDDLLLARHFLGCCRFGGIHEALPVLDHCRLPI